MKKVLYVPSPSEAVENKYTKIMYGFLGLLDDVSIFVLPKGRLNKLLFLIRSMTVDRFSYVIINWHENLMAKNGKIYFLGVLKFFVLFFVFRMSSRRIIYVRHNFYPHGMRGLSKHVASRFSDIIEAWSTIKVCHSPHLVEKGYSYVPHPLYPVSESDCRFGPEHQQDYFVVFGSIDRYKKIEYILEVWPPNICLVIAGVSKDDSYLSFLKELAKDKDVKFYSEYLPETVAQGLLKKSRGLILPHQSDEMIVSGSFFYAASVGVSTFALDSPFLSWMQNVEHFSGIKVFDNEEGLVKYLGQLTGGGRTSEGSRIRFEANKMFGKSKVLESWNKLLIIR
ncbi:MAG: hypothetical protein R3175_11525 [Marinobacter sp.]|uniref:hypothetical protein n=1 Tax=Marinobacter sp. TaxID=50741 RepID=UPI00299DBB87|nr:hypothetical protein [Marinobacter sp.]MDX1756681.1 hypothetical protein [Marinobacter sp.]